MGKFDGKGDESPTLESSHLMFFLANNFMGSHSGWLAELFKVVVGNLESI